VTAFRLRLGAPLLALACLAAPAGAVPLRPWFALGLASGSTLFDSHLADYQWNLAPRASWGALAEAGTGRAGLALRAWSSASSQHLDASASITDPRVRVTTLDLAGEFELTRLLGTGLFARASSGRVALTYDPDRVTMDAGGGTTTVELAPVHAWTWGGGVALRHALAGPWTATLAAERQSFAFDTAHRSGASVALARESFGNWNGRLELARLFGTR
jgi:hypothetical protein